MNANDGLVLGIDIGTQGVRVVAVAPSGEVVARAAEPLTVPPAGSPQEQSPMQWWNATIKAIAALGESRRKVGALAVSCTSGSVCAMDVDGSPVGPGLLYADPRKRSRDPRDASWAVAKIGGLVDDPEYPREMVRQFTSPGGFVTSRFLDTPAAIDVTQALKFGLDPAARTWTSIPVDEALMPEVVDTGHPIGVLSTTASAVTGLPIGVAVMAGATDGIAGQLACRPTPTRWAVAIGSTIVWKAMASSRIDAQSKGVYSHQGPGGWWFPGAAATAGARVLSTWASQLQLDRFGRTVMVTPDVAAAYPSAGVGERFPFVDPDFRPWSGSARDGAGRYAAEILGLAYLERWGCEVLVDLGCESPESIASTGGAVDSESFTRLRAEVQQRTIEVPAEPSSAFGAAVIAASEMHGDILRAGDAMVRFTGVVEPTVNSPDRWDDGYERFRQRCLNVVDWSEVAP